MTNPNAFDYCFLFDRCVRICAEIENCEYNEDFICTKDEFELCYMEKEDEDV